MAKKFALSECCVSHGEVSPPGSPLGQKESPLNYIDTNEQDTMSEANYNPHNYKTTDISQEPLAMQGKQNYKKSKNFDEL
jgi:hypothetical protein